MKEIDLIIRNETQNNKLSELNKSLVEKNVVITNLENIIFFGQCKIMIWWFHLRWAEETAMLRLTTTEGCRKYVCSAYIGFERFDLIREMRWESNLCDGITMRPDYWILCFIVKCRMSALHLIP